jgi:hypothetical protein
MNYFYNKRIINLSPLASCLLPLEKFNELAFSIIDPLVIPVLSGSLPANNIACHTANAYKNLINVQTLLALRMVLPSTIPKTADCCAGDSSNNGYAAPVY